MNEFEDDLRDTFRRDAAEISAPDIDAAALAARAAKGRRIRFGARMTLGLTVVVATGAILTVVRTGDDPTVTIVQPPDGKQPYLGLGSPSASPSLSSTPLPSLPGKTANEGGSSAEVAYDPPPLGGNYHLLNTTEALVDDDTNDLLDVYRVDDASGKAVRVSVADDERQANGASESSTDALSADGRHIVFWSLATNMTSEGDDGVADLFMRDLLTGTTTKLELEYKGSKLYMGVTPALELSLSADGRHVAFVSEFSGHEHVFAYRVEDRTIILASVSSSEEISNGGNITPDISSDGRFVAFSSNATNLTDSPCSAPPCKSQLYLRDTETGQTELVSVSPKGAQGNSWSHRPEILDSLAGKIRFYSCATNLITDDGTEPPPQESCIMPGSAYIRDRVHDVTTQSS